MIPFLLIAFTYFIANAQGVVENVCAYDQATRVLQPGEEFIWKCSMIEDGIINATIRMLEGRSSVARVVFSKQIDWKLYYQRQITLSELECTVENCQVNVTCLSGLMCAMEFDGGMTPYSQVPAPSVVPKVEGECKSTCRIILWIQGILSGAAATVAILVGIKISKTCGKVRKQTRNRMSSGITIFFLLQIVSVLYIPRADATWAENVPFRLQPMEALHVPESHTYSFGLRHILNADDHTKNVSGLVGDIVNGTCVSFTGCRGRYSFWSELDASLQDVCVRKDARIYVPGQATYQWQCNDRPPYRRTINANIGMIRPHASGYAQFRNDTKKTRIYHKGVTSKKLLDCDAEQATCQVRLQCIEPVGQECVFVVHGGMVSTLFVQAEDVTTTEETLECNKACQNRIWGYAGATGIGSVFLMLFIWKYILRWK